MRPEDWKIKNMLHRVSMQLHIEETREVISVSNRDMAVILEAIEGFDPARAVERMRGSK